MFQKLQFKGVVSKRQLLKSQNPIEQMWSDIIA